MVRRGRGRPVARDRLRAPSPCRRRGATASGGLAHVGRAREQRPAGSGAGRSSGRSTGTLGAHRGPAPGRGRRPRFQPTRPGNVPSRTATPPAPRTAAVSGELDARRPQPAGAGRVAERGRAAGSQRERGGRRRSSASRSLHLGLLAREHARRRAGRAPGTSGSRPGRGRSGRRRGRRRPSTSVRWLTEKLPSGCALAGAAERGEHATASEEQDALHRSASRARARCHGRAPSPCASASRRSRRPSPRARRRARPCRRGSANSRVERAEPQRPVRPAQPGRAGGRRA